jgi:hypothetical protein
VRRVRAAVAVRWATDCAARLGRASPSRPGLLCRLSKAASCRAKSGRHAGVGLQYGARPQGVVAGDRLRCRAGTAANYRACRARPRAAVPGRRR